MPTTAEVKFMIVGLHENADRVLARVFSKKLDALVRALEAADTATNGGRRHEFVIANLSAASPASATLAEQVVSRKHVTTPPIEAFGVCINAVNSGRASVDSLYLDIIPHLMTLAKGVEDDFDRGELTVNGNETVLVDHVFLKRVSALIDQPDDEIDHQHLWFSGEAIGTFDGQILEVDVRGTVPKAILRLTSGKKDIPCLCPGISAEQIGNLLERRVEATGRAVYDGTSGLPIRLEMTSTPKIVKPDVDFSRWKGSLEIDPGAEWDDW